MNAMKATEPPRIKKISIAFIFDEQYVRESNSFAATYVTNVFEHLRNEDIRRNGWGKGNRFFAFGTWSSSREIKISRYNRAPTIATIENVWDEKNIWEQERAVRANKILRECPDTLIRDSIIGTIKIIDAIKNNSMLKNAKYKISFRIAYTGIQTEPSEAYLIVYDSTTGFIY